MRIATGRKWSVLTPGAVGVLLGIALLGHSEPAPTASLDLDRAATHEPRRTRCLVPPIGIGQAAGGDRQWPIAFPDRQAASQIESATRQFGLARQDRAEDGYFINRFIGNINWIDSNYVVGPERIDGKPAIIMEYAPGTPLFANMHDELREVAPGLYMGPVYERCPCPKLRGYVRCSWMIVIAKRISVYFAGDKFGSVTIEHFKEHRRFMAIWRPQAL